MNAIREALPFAEQIADRFHIVKNYSERIYEEVKKMLPELKQFQLTEKEPANDYSQTPFPNIVRTSEKQKVNLERRKELARIINDLYSLLFTDYRFTLRS